MLKALDPNSDTSAGVLASLAALSDQARRLLDPAVNVRAFLDSLRRNELHTDAISVLTHVLPKQYALAWGCECWQQLYKGVEVDPADRSAIAAAQRWLKDPTEENRRAALELVDRLGLHTAAAWLAAAAGWSGGSVLPPGQPEVPPPASLTGDAVGAAVILAAATDPENFGTRADGCVERAFAAFASGNA